MRKVCRECKKFELATTHAVRSGGCAQVADKMHVLTAEGFSMMPAGSSSSGSPKALVVTQRKQSATAKNGFR